MTDEPFSELLDHESTSTRADTNLLSEAAGQFDGNTVAEGCFTGCLEGCGCLVLISVGIFLTIGTAVASIIRQ